MKDIKSVFLNNRFFLLGGMLCVLLVFSYFFPLIQTLSKITILVFGIISILELFLLFKVKKGVHGFRFTPEKLSNGDDNEIKIYLENFYPFEVRLRVMDELPEQFQKRDVNFYLTLKPRENKSIVYNVRPVKRGEYFFGAVNVFVSSGFGLISRRERLSADIMVPVYPSYIQMRKYELLAISNNLVNAGIKKIRKIGHNLEFEQIKEYVSGDDFRTINWKATARKAQLMVNTYQDEKSQQVYSLIDKGRVMEMPFKGLSLLDYAINASLVISNIAIQKDDMAGIITFQHKTSTIVPASKRNSQMMRIMEALYRQKTAYKETDFSRLSATVRTKLNHRSLLLLYTNFEALTSLHRQLPFLQSMSRSHVLVVIFFENTEVKSLMENKPKNVKEIYHKAIAEKFVHEKKQIVKELNRYGIHAILTSPQDLTINTINKYLELKARGVI